MQLDSSDKLWRNKSALHSNGKYEDGKCLNFLISKMLQLVPKCASFRHGCRNLGTGT